MKQITDPQYYYALCQEYETLLRKQLNVRSVWLDSMFYNGFRQWVKDKHNIINDGTVVLTFEDDRDYTLFMLKWK